MPEASASSGGFFDEFANKGGGSGAPSFDWDDKIGSGVIGEVVDTFRTVVTAYNSTEPRLDKRGREQPQLNVTLKTKFRNWDFAKKPGKDEEGNELPASADIGLRRIYVKHRMIDAVGKALKDAGAKDLVAGGELGVKITKFIDVGQANPLADYAAQYKAPAAGTGGFFEEAAEKAADPWGTTPSKTEDPPPF